MDGHARVVRLAVPGDVALDAANRYITVDERLSSPLKKASLTGFHATAKHIAAKAVSPSSETLDEDDLNDQDGSSGRNKHEQGANSARHGLLRGAGADELAHQQR